MSGKTSKDDEQAFDWFEVRLPVQRKAALLRETATRMHLAADRAPDPSYRAMLHRQAEGYEIDADRIVQRVTAA